MKENLRLNKSYVEAFNEIKKADYPEHEKFINLCKRKRQTAYAPNYWFCNNEIEDWTYSKAYLKYLIQAEAQRRITESAADINKMDALILEMIKVENVHNKINKEGVDNLQIYIDTYDLNTMERMMKPNFEYRIDFIRYLIIKGTHEFLLKDVTNNKEQAVYQSVYNHDKQLRQENRSSMSSLEELKEDYAALKETFEDMNRRLGTNFFIDEHNKRLDTVDNYRKQIAHVNMMIENLRYLSNRSKVMKKLITPSEATAYNSTKEGKLKQYIIKRFTVGLSPQEYEYFLLRFKNKVNELGLEELETLFNRFATDRAKYEFKNNIDMKCTSGLATDKGLKFYYLLQAIENIEEAA